MPVCRVVRTYLGLVSLALASGEARPALASGLDECVAAAERGQELRDAGKLLTARDKFVLCARASCPASVRSECSTWLGAVEARLPAVVFGVRDEEGRDLTRVRVVLDGVLLVSSLDGRFVSVDPGEHEFRFEADGYGPVSERLLIREGDLRRSVEVKLPRAQARAASPVARQADTPAAAGSIPVVTYVLAAVAAVATASYGYFGISGKNDMVRLRATCAPACAAPDVDAARRELLVANLSFGLGVVALGGAIWTYLARPTPPPAANSAQRSPAF